MGDVLRFLVAVAAIFLVLQYDVLPHVSVSKLVQFQTVFYIAFVAALVAVAVVDSVKTALV
jgi:hypothetical protein